MMNFILVNLVGLHATGSSCISSLNIGSKICICATDTQ